MPIQYDVGNSSYYKKTKKGLKIHRLRGEDDTIIYIEIHLPNQNQTQNLLKLVSNYNNTDNKG